jgi:flagellar biosynthesis/type III secretory pathway protein FliH
VGRGQYPKKNQHRAAISESLKGRPKSEATRKKMTVGQAARRAFEKQAHADYAEGLENAREHGLDAEKTKEELVSRFFGLGYEFEDGEPTHPFVRKLLGLGPLPGRK